MEASLPKGYQPEDVEKKWYDFWTEKGYFIADADSDKPPFCMVIPPPNVTGSLHMGHALNNTIQDILARFKRMDGYNVLWLPGTDHAGIATQNVVEKMIAKEGLNRHTLGRDAFIERVWNWKEESGSTIINQLKRLGSSCDWSRERFTMDEGLSKAVKQVFLTLFKEGLVERDQRLINWCPRCGTALSDLEVEHEEKDGAFYYVRYPLAGGDDGSGVIVATTRPETMLGDTAVAVNPDDKRYKKLIGKNLKLPLTDREIPVIADTMVDTKFGTGAVKITPAHDFADEAAGRRHGLPFVSVIDREGAMTGDIPGKYKNLNRFEARKLICEDLKESGLLQKIESMKHNVGHCYRCKDVTEPLLTLQWFVRIKPLAEKGIEAVKSKKIRIVPEQWETTYFNWMENIQDWCISRQIWWGHQIPVYYCPKCNGDRIIITLRENQNDSKRLTGLYNDFVKDNLDFKTIMKDVDFYLIGEGVTPIPEGSACTCGAVELIQDPDVLDTWFSSGLWPFSTLGWPEKTKELKAFYPTSVLVTGFDILFFWVARMIMMGIKFMGDAPFRDVYIHALVRDASGQKMSKSKGNVIDPLVIMDKYGTDAFRFTLTALASQGRDVRLSEDRIENYRHFVNKIWNAARFVMMNISDLKPEKERAFAPEKLNPLDRWILAKLNETVNEVRKSYETYNFNDSANIIYRFLWNDFCDWYIELSKLRMEEEEVKYILWHCLITSLKLLHPIMPFVTEEIYQKLQHFEDSIMTAPFPKADKNFIGMDVSHVEQYINVVRAIRNVKSEMNISPALKPKTLLVLRDDKTAFIKGMKASIEALGRCEVDFTDNIPERPKNSALAVADGIDIWVNLEGMIKAEDEIKRITKELKKTEKDVEFLVKRLSNEDYLKNAPEAVVEDDKIRLKGFREKLAKLAENLKFLEGMGK